MRSPLRISGATSAKALMNCELTVASMFTVPPSSRRPRMCSGAYPSVPLAFSPSASVYSMSAPRRRRASTSGAMGRWRMRSMPSRMMSAPSVAAKNAAAKRIAVPAAPISTRPVRADIACISARVSSQSATSSAAVVYPPTASMTIRRALSLLLSGRVTVACRISSGGKIAYFIVRDII